MRKPHPFLFVFLASLSCGTFGGSSGDEKVELPPDDPSKPPPVVSGERFKGTFVSSSRGANGVDGADGSEAKPFKTLKEGILIAQQRKERLFACAEKYEEAMELLEGVSVYGYLDCTQSPWAKSDRRALVVAPTGADPAFTAKDLVAAARVDSFDFVGPDQTKLLAGVIASSIAGTVFNTKDLTLVDVSFRGGDASNGIDGAAPKPNTFTGQAEGAPPLQQTLCTGQFCSFKSGTRPGSAGGSIQCATGGSNPGGMGGDGVVFDDFGNSTAPINTVHAHGRPTAATSATAIGGPPKNGGPDPDPSKGGVGAVGTLGTNGANGTWSFTAQGFNPGNGTEGTPGGPGQGGGGGGAATCWYNGGTCSDTTHGDESARGGGGGAGGCGGLPGGAGKGGGASIGLFVVNSTVKMERGRIEGGRGGAAGKGTLGGEGLVGGNGGKYPLTAIASGEKYKWGGSGGGGGAGGPAGSSGHGAPGPSIGLVFTGDTPSARDTTVVGGEAGAGAPTITATGRVPIPAVVGESKAEHKF